MILEITFHPEPNLCMRQTTTLRALTAAETAQVGRQLRALQTRLLDQFNQQTGAGSGSETVELIAP